MFEAPRLIETVDGIVADLSGCDQYGTPGTPILPVRGWTTPVPDGFEPRDIRIIPGKTVSLQLARPVAFAQEAIPLSADPQNVKRTTRDEAVYKRTTRFPAFEKEEGKRQHLDYRHGQQELTLTLHPVQVIPSENVLLAHGELSIEVTWQAVTRDAAKRRKDKVRTLSSRTLSLGGITGETMVSPPATGDPIALASALTPQTVDHLIIAPAAFTNTPAPWNLSALMAARSMMNLSSKVVTTEWIYANYAGRDNAERIRTFICDAYETWSTRYVLLVGIAQLLPTRNLYCSFSGNIGSIPSDSIYYGCLDGDFDYDGDQVYGEIGDGIGGGDVDLVAEVQVGRFPVASTSELNGMIRKTLTYEAQAASALTRTATVGEYLGFGGPAEYATGAMNQIRFGATDAGFTSLGIENPVYESFFDSDTTLYDSPEFTWSWTNMVNLLNQDIHVFNHLGHGAPRIGFKMNAGLTIVKQAISSLSNSLPYFIYSQACEVGRFDDYIDCFAEQLVTATNGPVATLMNTRYGWGYQGVIDGPSQRFQRKFWDGIFSAQAHQFSFANMHAKEQLRHLVSSTTGDVFRWCYYEISLFGDPATPFAARALRQPPTLGHEGLGNQSSETVAYRIAAEIGPAGIYVTDSPRLLWRTSLAPDRVHTNDLLREVSSLYAAQIPAQPLGTTLYYSLRATTVAGVEGQWPASGEQTFTVTPALSLEVRGTPEAWGAVSPAYGLYSLASGVVIRATAPTRVAESTGVSRALLGYSITGSVTSAPSAEVTFALEAVSTLTWRWQTEHALVHTSNVARTLNTSIWCTPDTVTNSLVAPETMVLSGTYAFVGWYLDGLRQPAAPGVVLNPVPSINMAVPHVAYAHYVDITRDSGANGIPDWWEYRFFGTNNWSLAADDDQDAFSTLQEYADRTDPLNPASYPQAPFIVHTPLAYAQGIPPPFLIEAMITDSNCVETALLIWRRNEEPWQTNALVNVAGNKYNATIPLPGSPRDQFRYQIVARDPAGYTATNGPHTIGLAYPQLVLAPTSGCLTVFQHVAGEHEDFLTLTNSGNVTLSWTLQPGTLESVDAVMTDWTTNTFDQSWRVTDQRSTSAPYSFYGSLVSEGGYTSPAVRACLLSPLFHPASGARLFFKQFINTELDSLKPGNAYDGGIVEVSTNNGVTFQQLDGPYTHRLTGWTYSPWTNNTPCFAGNGSAGWQEVSFDLSAFAGQAIQIRFHAGGDNNTDLEGWYIDDVRVGPVTSPDWPDWLASAATSGMIVMNRGISVPIYTLATGSTNRQERLPLHILSNDPWSPNIFVDWAFKIRDAPCVVAVTASQTSTNGEGVVMLNADVAETDRESLSLQIDYSSDGGATWSEPYLISAQSQYGFCMLNVWSSRVEQVATRWVDAPITNRVNLFWSTQPHLPSFPLLVTNMLMRVRAASPYFSAPEAITHAFMVDNESPTAPTALASTSHTIGLWSGASLMSMQWNESSDGLGIGDIAYRRRATATTNNIFAALERIPGATAQLRPPDGSNLWVEVQAIDLFGNASGIARSGPYCVDTIPPSASNAFIRVQRSAFGSYAVGVNVPTEWGGFTDTLSGIAGYSISPQPENNFAASLGSVNTQGVFAVAVLNATNQVSVSAIDRAGNVSTVVTDNVWVLDPTADIDGDSFTAADEEIVGTDATDALSRFRFGLAGVQTSTTGVTMQVWWDSLMGRRYTLLASPALTVPDWQPVVGMTGLPGTGNVVTNTVLFGSPVFLRLSVTAP